MSIWGEIKHALNSTLGTADFKPLNEIVMQTKDLAASDYLYKVINNNEVKKEHIPTGTWTTIATMTMHRNGSARIKFDMTSSVRYGGVKIATPSGSTYINASDETTAGWVSQSINISFSKGDTIQISIGNDSSRTPTISVKNMQLCAVELDITGVSVQIPTA